MIDITKYTKEDFENVPLITYHTAIENSTFIDSLVIIPKEELHDSGWATMEFVALDREGKIMYKFNFGSDVIHLDGIGGTRKMVENPAWAMDCLPCGYLRLFCKDKIKYSSGISDFQIVGGLCEN